MTNILIDGRVAEALIEWLNSNGEEIKKHLTPCCCDMRVLADDGCFEVRLFVRCVDD